MSLTDIPNPAESRVISSIRKGRPWSLQAMFALIAFAALVIETLLAVIALNLLQKIGAEAAAQTPLVVILWIVGVGLTLGGWLIAYLDVVRPLRAMISSLELIALGNYTSPLAHANVDLIREVITRLSALRSEIAQIGADSQQSIERRVQVLSGAITIGQSLSGVREADAVLQTGVEALCSAFRQVNYARVYLPNSSSTEAVPSASAGLQAADGRDLSPDARRPVSLIEVNPVSQVFTARHGLISRQAAAPTGQAASTAAASDNYASLLAGVMRSRCLLPLLIDDQVAGVLELYSIDEEAFATSDLPLFQTVADQIAGALQNAELFEDLQTRLSEVELFNNRLTGRTWRDYTARRRATLPDGNAASEDDSPNALWREAITRNAYVEQVEGDQIRFAVPIQLSNTVLGAAEWVVARDTYTPAARQMAESLTARLALVADNIRLLETSKAQTAREQLLNTISGKLMQQVDIEQILQTAVQELGQALRVSQAVIRLDDSRTNN